MLGGGGPVSNKIGYLIEKISKSVLKVRSDFLLAVSSKMQEERYRLKEELLSKIEPGFDNLWNSQPIWIAEDTKIRRFIVKKVCSGEKAKAVAG